MFKKLIDSILLGAAIMVLPSLIAAMVFFGLSWLQILGVCTLLTIVTSVLGAETGNNAARLFSAHPSDGDCRYADRSSDKCTDSPGWRFGQPFSFAEGDTSALRIHDDSVSSSLWQDDDWMDRGGIVINPSTGLPMLGDSIGGFDAGGHAFGETDSSSFGCGIGLDGFGD